MRGVNLSELYKQGNSIPEVHKTTGVPISTIRRKLAKDGVLRSRADGVRNAAAKGRLSSRKGVRIEFSEQWKQNIAEGRRRWGEANAKGESLKPNGYLEITRGHNKGKTKHRVEAEAAIGRKLLPSEFVHHIDHDKTNNNTNNLMVMSASEHARLHALENVKRRTRDNKGRFK